MSRFFFYKLTTDNGGAPCIADGLLSLAICKPTIRRTAVPGDLIFGFAANSLHADNRLIFIACVTEKITGGKYYVHRKFAQRGDCIYKLSGDRFQWRLNANHHGPMDLVHDLGQYPGYHNASVLLSDDYRYFGANGTDAFKSKYPLIKQAVEFLGRGHRVYHPEKLRKQLQVLKEKIWQETHTKIAGAPSSTPRRGDCHRSKSCVFL